MRISHVRLRPSALADRASGLLGWVSFRVNGSLIVRGVALRQTAEGSLALSFPADRDRESRQHFLVQPVDDETRRLIEGQVFEALGLYDGVSLEEGR